jgi:hypothetical protein
VRERIAEQRHQPIAELFCHMAAHLRDRRRGSIEIGVHEVAPLLGIEPCRNAGRIDEITEHNREVAAFAAGLAGCCESWLAGGFWRGWRRFWVRDSAQSSDSVEQLAAVPHNADAQVFQVLRRQVRQDRVVDLVLTEGRLVSFEAKAPQPTPEVHDDAQLLSEA